MARTYLDGALLAQLAAGHTFDIPRCAEVIESALAGLNAKTGMPDRLAGWLNDHPGQPPPAAFFADKPNVIIDLSVSGRGASELTMATVLEDAAHTGRPPALFLTLHSPSLDIPMRVEIPLRAVFKHGAQLTESYTVYLHALLADDGNDFVYYGITRRPWNLRFLEHVKAGRRKGAASRRLFARTLTQLIDARVAQRFGGESIAGPALAGMTTTLCLVGGTRDQALAVEEYLVDKYSLAGKHSRGLNMIPGGAEGIRIAQRFRTKHPTVDHDETMLRELGLDSRLSIKAGLRSTHHPIPVGDPGA